MKAFTYIRISYSMNGNHAGIFRGGQPLTRKIVGYQKFGDSMIEIKI